MSEVQFEDRFAQRLRAYAVAGASTVDRDGVVRAVSAGAAERRSFGRRIRLVRWLDVLAEENRPLLSRLALTAAVAIGVVFAVALWGGQQSQVVSPLASPLPSATTPSPTTRAAATWSSVLRFERPGQQVVDYPPEPVDDVDGQHRAFVDFTTYADRPFATVPLTWVEFQVAGRPPRDTGEGGADQHVVYGLFFDLDKDGAADLQAGMERGSAADSRSTWITDLRTGATTACACPTVTHAGLTIESWYPGERTDSYPSWFEQALIPFASGRFAVDASGLVPPPRYYLWASTAETGGALATDYAPNAGWAELTPDATSTSGGTTVERVNPDRPGPIRTEPVGGAPSVASGPPGVTCATLPVASAEEACVQWEAVYRDAPNDTGPSEAGLVDILQVFPVEDCWAGVCVYFDVAETPFDVAETPTWPPPHPSGQWLGYGLVVDTTGDGMADFRFGMDSVGEDDVQMWLTNLATGRTLAFPVGTVEDPRVMDAVFPGRSLGGPSDGSLHATRFPDGPFRFYVWASSIDADGNEATDFAPDVGWLEFEQAP